MQQTKGRNRCISAINLDVKVKVVLPARGEYFTAHAQKRQFPSFWLQATILPTPLDSATPISYEWEISAIGKQVLSTKIAFSPC